MEDILELLKSDPKKAIETIRSQSTKKSDDIDKYIKEYRDFDRNQREGQLEKIQMDKNLDAGKVSKMVKIYINHAQNIVETLAAFVIGKPVTLIPSEDNNLAKLVKQIWRVNRIDSKILDSTIIKFSQTQVAMQFYIVDAGESSILSKILAFFSIKAGVKEIKVKVLDNTKGTMTPYFDTKGDMLLFMWEYKMKEGDKEINNVQIWNTDNMLHLKDLVPFSYLPHGFDRIPIVYDSQDEPLWYTVKSPIDRHEVALSKLGDANDYSGHPILVTEGVVENMPLKSESGKHFNIPIKLGGDDGKTVIKGSVSFLEAKTAPESNKLELDKLEDTIAYGSGIPNLSLEKLKSLGNVAEKTVKLMFLATDIKASLKQSYTRTFVERCLNIIISGVTKTTNTSMANEGKGLYYDIQFNSILPSDIAETVTYLKDAVEGKFVSQKTAIGLIDLVDDHDAEVLQIELENKITEAKPPIVTK
ncbi:phage portal protein [Flavobacterium sp. CF136]|uniref:phage portal protein n=1 Tax=Flavobacterium sp. (strain CF136) TaxID=1144313 RepID=UPI0002719F11|nr:phage portal protein [Flavobacterium sp. CF136]EJL66303.1 Phage portal protein, SPP1 Gp6 [Flavobacterium sp. CF136]